MSIIYTVGHKFTLQKGTEIDKLFGGTTELDRDVDLYVGPDKFAHYLNDGIMYLDRGVDTDSYNVRGIAEWIYEYISQRLSLDEMLEFVDETKESFIKHVADALEDLGFLGGGE